ncbi:hypothetical protein R6Q59_015170 [Mikania micrantha]
MQKEEDDEKTEEDRDNSRMDGRMAVVLTMACRRQGRGRVRGLVRVKTFVGQCMNEWFLKRKRLRFFATESNSDRSGTNKGTCNICHVM